MTIHIWKRSAGIVYFTYSGEGYGIFEGTITSELLSDVVASGEVTIGRDIDV